MKKVIITLHNGETINEEITDYKLSHIDDEARFEWYFKSYGQSYKMSDLKSISIILQNGKQVINIG